jgi:hypothetical protein
MKARMSQSPSLASNTDEDEPTRVPFYAEPDYPLVWQESPQDVKTEQQRSGGPRDETVELWGTTPVFWSWDRRIGCYR